MNPDSTLERHPDLYFPHGDVVLAVKQTPKSGEREKRPKYRLFRVHKFLLEHNSPSFANFFADAEATPTEVYDGVPLAEMHGDRAEDFTLLLSYLYNPSSLVFKRHDPNTPLTVSGVLRLADKYLIQPLYHRLVQQVCDDWPTTLDDYDVQQAELDMFRQVTSGHGPHKFTPDGGRLADVIPEPVSAILFAQEFDCPQILPAAFYSLSLIPLTDDWDDKSDWPPNPRARWSLFDRENLLRYTRGCQMLNECRPCVSLHVRRLRYSLGLRTFQDANRSRAVNTSPAFSRSFGTRANTVGRLTGIHCISLPNASNTIRFPSSRRSISPAASDECYQRVFFGLLGEHKRVWDNLSKWFMLE